MLAPVMVSNRFALKDFEYEGVKIAQGTAIGMIWAAGNRDPRVFEDPNSYNPRRSPRSPMTFGGGVHVCPGRYAGSHVVSVALKALVNPRIKIDLAGERPRWLPRSFMRQADRVPVTIRRQP
jgi:cytochrome P450